MENFSVLTKREKPISNTRVFQDLSKIKKKKKKETEAKHRYEKDISPRDDYFIYSSTYRYPLLFNSEQKSSSVTNAFRDKSLNPRAETRGNVIGSTATTKRKRRYRERGDFDHLFHSTPQISTIFPVQRIIIIP